MRTPPITGYPEHVVALLAHLDALVRRAAPQAYRKRTGPRIQFWDHGPLVECMPAANGVMLRVWGASLLSDAAIAGAGLDNGVARYEQVADVNDASLRAIIRKAVLNNRELRLRKGRIAMPPLHPNRAQF